MTRWSRRGVLSGLFCAAGAVQTAASPLSRSQPLVGRPLPPWEPGGLDIHHIATGRGDATLVIGPQGQTLLIDAGATASPLTDSVPPYPDASRRPGEWIGRYVARHVAATDREGLDAALITHLHPDHLGEVDPASPAEPAGRYRLTGIADVDAWSPIRRLVDRGHPAYDWPAENAAAFSRNYVAYVRAREADGRAVERLSVGSGRQLARADASTRFEVRCIAGNGEIWSGREDGAVSRIPPLTELPRADWPDENMLSAALRIRMGAFAYYAAGDLTANSFDEALPWRNVGAPAAQAAGRVDVAVAPHHGMYDGVDGAVVRALAPRNWIILGWHASHPNLSALERLFSQRHYDGPRDVYATTLTNAAALVNRRLVDRFASTRGHVVVRVSPGGGTYRMIVTDNKNEDDIVSFVSDSLVASSSDA